MQRFKIAFFKTPFDLCVLHIYHVTRVATLSVRILVFSAKLYDASFGNAKGGRTNPLYTGEGGKTPFTGEG